MKKVMKGIFQNIFKGIFQYLEKLHELHNDLLFLSKRMNIEKDEKLVANLHDKTEYVIQIRNLKQALNHKLLLEKVQRVIKFNQDSWLKPYIDMNTDLRKKAKNEFDKYFLKLMNNAVFGKTLENVRKHRDIKLVTTERRRNCLVSEPNYYTTKFFTENLVVIEMKKTEILVNKLVHLGLSILELSKILMYEFWHDYVKPKYSEKVKFCQMNTDSFINIAEVVESRFDIQIMNQINLYKKGKRKK